MLGQESSEVSQSMNIGAYARGEKTPTQNKVTITKKIPDWIKNILFNNQKIFSWEEQENIKHQDTLFFQEYYKLDQKDFVVLSSKIEETYKKFSDYIPDIKEKYSYLCSQKDIADSVIESLKDEKDDIHYLLFESGYQSGKTLIQRWAFAQILNLAVNTPGIKQTDIFVMGYSISSAHRNIISKFCDEYGLVAPSPRSTVWYPHRNVKVSITTSRLLSHDSIVGSSISCLILDEQSIADIKTYKQAIGRLTGRMKDAKGYNKTFVVATRNPSTISKVSKLADEYPGIKKHIMSCSSNPTLTERNKQIAIMNAGGENTNAFLNNWHGIAMPIDFENLICPQMTLSSSIHPVLSIAEETFLNNEEEGIWKPMYTCINIGHDNGYYSGAGWVASGLMEVVKKNKIKREIHILKEIYYDTGHGREDHINAKKDGDIVALVKEMLQYTTRVSLTMPHDSTYNYNHTKKLIDSTFKNYNVRVILYTEKVRVNDVVDAMRLALEFKKIKIDGLCKILIDQMNQYQYKKNQMMGESETGKPMDEKYVIHKSFDHLIDASRYSIQFFLNHVMENLSLNFKTKIL